jgi:hypothetical protein
MSNSVGTYVTKSVKTNRKRKKKVDPVPIKIVKKRQVAYPNKRDNYRRYNNATWKWEDVFEEIETLKNEGKLNYIEIVSVNKNIKYGTLRNKYNEWKNNKELNINEDHRGGHNKIFSELEEREMYDYIVKVFIDCNLAFSNEHLKFLAIQKYHLLQKEKNKDYIDDETFAISDGWVNDYKKRWKLSSLRTKLNRNAVNIIPAELDTFLKDCKEAVKDKDIEASNIYNLDETFWRICSANITVIGLTNSDHRKINAIIDEKAGFTAIFIISYTGEFLKPYIIMKGITTRTLAKINDVNNNDVIKKYSSSGWISVTILTDILDMINKRANGKKSVLILDKYSVHTDEVIQNKANELNIKLIYVPTGKTSTNQPLDVSINGPIKSIGKSISNKIFMKDPFAEYTLVNSINAMIEAKSKISKETITESFKSACGI